MYFGPNSQVEKPLYAAVTQYVYWDKIDTHVILFHSNICLTMASCHPFIQLIAALCSLSPECLTLFFTLLFFFTMHLCFSLYASFIFYFP